MMKKVSRYRYPEISSIQSMVNGIWDRKYYTNQGPLAINLEKELQQRFCVRNAVVMTNCDIALLIALLAIGEIKSALIPDNHPYYLINSLFRMNISEKKYIHDMFGAGLRYLSLPPSQEQQVTFGFHSLGIKTNVQQLIDYCSSSHSDLILLSDNLYESFQADAEGKCNLLEIFSFDQTQFVNAGEGACIVTNNDEIASKLRNIRSSYGAGPLVEIPFTGNGRMSEFQAGMAILSLQGLDNALRHAQETRLTATTILLVHGICAQDIFATGDAYLAFRCKNASLLPQLENQILSLGYSRLKPPFCLSLAVDASSENLFRLH